MPASPQCRLSRGKRSGVEASPDECSHDRGKYPPTNSYPTTNCSTFFSFVSSSSQRMVIASANNRYFYYPNEQDQNEKMINVRLLNLNFNAFPPLPTTASSPAPSSSASFVLSNDGGAAHAALLSGLSSSSSLNSTGDSAVVDRFLQHANMMFDVSW